MTYTDNNEYNRRAIPNTAEEENVDSDLVREDMPSFEYFDGAMLNWVKDLNISADGNDGFKRIPVMWYGTERAHQIKSGMEIRDRSGTIILPVITVGRTGVSKSPSIKGAYYANIPAVRDYLGGTITVAKKLKHAKSPNSPTFFLSILDPWAWQASSTTNRLYFLIIFLILVIFAGWP